MGALILIAGAAAMMYLMYIPQQKAKKQLAALLSSLAEGDAVLTTGGIYGVITEVDGDDIYLEVAPGIELHLAKSAIQRKITTAADTTTESK